MDGSDDYLRCAGMPWAAGLVLIHRSLAESAVSGSLCVLYQFQNGVKFASPEARACKRDGELEHEITR